jgi:hypothetical protein
METRWEYYREIIFEGNAATVRIQRATRPNAANVSGRSSREVFFVPSLSAYQPHQHQPQFTFAAEGLMDA